MPSTLTATESTRVANLVQTSVEDAKCSLHYLHPAQNEDGAPGLEKNLRLLRGALEMEKGGSNRSSLVAALRSTIRANEAALDADEEASDGPDKSDKSDETPAEEAIAPAVDPSPMVHLRYAPRSAFAHHPRLADIPMSADVAAYLAGKKDERAEALAEDLAAFNDGIYSHGIIEPLKVVPCPPLLTGADDGVRWWVVDGRTRIQSAQDLDEIPFVEVLPDEVDAIIEHTITGRRTWTKGQKAYLAVLRNPELLEGEQGKRTDLETSRTECGKSAREEIAGRFGVSLRLLEQAIEVVRTMDSLREGYPKKVEEMEMEVWAGTGLAAVLSGLKGFQASFGKPKPKPLPATAASVGLAKLAKATADFAEWTQPQVMLFRAEAQKFWDELDPQVSEFLTWVKAGHAAEIERIIAAHKPAEAEGEGGAA